MAMLNAPAMECDRVNLRWSVPVQKRQQIFETVPVSHRAPLSDEVTPLPEQLEPHCSTVPFRTQCKGNIRDDRPTCPLWTAITWRIGPAAVQGGLCGANRWGQSMPAITLIGMEYLHLARLGLRRPDDHRIQNTSKVTDALRARRTT
jgi:hypothetical protein